MTAAGGAAVCRWDTSAATIADGGATFVIPKDTTRIVKNVAGNTLINVIEGSAEQTDAGANLYMTRVFPA